METGYTVFEELGYDEYERILAEQTPSYAQRVWQQTQDAALWLKAFVLDHWRTLARGMAISCALSAAIYLLSAVIVLLLAPLIGPSAAVIVGCAVDVVGGGVAVYALNRVLEPERDYGF